MTELDSKKFGYMAYPGIAIEKFPKKLPTIPLEWMLEKVCEMMHEDILSVRSRSRQREYVVCRQIYYFIARKYSNKSLSEIGATLGYDHATVLHGSRTVINLSQTDRKFKEQVTSIDNKISQYFYKQNN